MKANDSIAIIDRECQSMRLKVPSYVIMNLLGCLLCSVVIARLSGDTKHFHSEEEELGP